MLLALALAAQSFVPTLASTIQEEPRRGWLGVAIEVDAHSDAPLTASEVADGSPADAAGMEDGDRLIALDGTVLSSYESLIERLREHGPGSEVTLTVRRALEVELDQRGFGERGGPRLGVHLGQMDEGDGTRWIVRQTQRGWPAVRAGLQSGDRIVSLNGSQPADFDELQALMADVEPGHGVELWIERDLKVRLGSRPGESGALLSLGERIEGLSGEGGVLRLNPRLEAPAPSDLEHQLRQEIAGLNEELRALREELRTLRRELATLRVR